MSVDRPMETYRAACARYATAVVTATRTRDEAAERYRREAAEIKDAARRAVTDRDTAMRELATAKKQVTEVDDSCADVWRRLGSYIGPKHTGLTPPPRSEDELGAIDEVRARLDQTRRTIALVQRGEVPFEPPRQAVAIAAAIGVLVGVVAALAAGLILATGGTGDNAQALSRAGALVTLFIGAFAGIPVVSAWMATRHRIGTRPIHIGACVLGGVVAMCALSPLMLA